MTKTYVIDTNVILAEGKKVFHGFGENNVVIPYRVVKELESKRDDVELGYYAREALKDIVELKAADPNGSINSGISLGEGKGTIRVEMNHVDAKKLPASLASTNILADARTLVVTYGLREDNIDAILVTRDVTLQILADILKVPSITLSDSGAADVDSYIREVPEFFVSSEDIDKLYIAKTIKLDSVDVPFNTGVLLKSFEDSKKTALVVAKAEWSFNLIETTKIGKIESKSKEQALAINYLMDNSIGVVSLGGRAGSGKTMLSLAAAIELVEDSSNKFDKVVVFRPINAVGGSEQELGFLPGTIDEKLAPIMQPVFDTLGTFKNRIEVEAYKKGEKLEFRSIAHARGSTLSNCIIMVDEVQNLSKSTIGTLLTRAGNNSRVFLMWDVNQIDAKYTGKFDGVFRVVRYLFGKKLFAHVSLNKSERSPVSEMASGILEEM